MANDPTTIESIEYYTWGGNAQGGNNNGIKIKVGPGEVGGSSSDFFVDHFYSSDDVSLIYNSNAVTIKDTNGNEWSQSSTQEIPVVNNSNFSYSIPTGFKPTISSSDINSGATTSESEINLEFNTIVATNTFSNTDITVDTGATISDFVTIFDVTVIDGKYYINFGIQKTLVLRKGDTYRLDQSHNSNQNHPLRLSTTSNGTHGGGIAYTTGVTVVGTPGSPGAYTQIDIDSNFSDGNLYYYCSNHSGMGGQITVTTDALTITGSKKYVAKHTTTIEKEYTIKVLENTISNIQITGNNNASDVFSFTYDAPSWSQLGAGIDGEADYDESGYSVSLSSDGTKLAIGAPRNDGGGNLSGQVRVYENINGTWTKLGDDIDGAAGDWAGSSVSLSSDGTIVAIGAPKNNDGGNNNINNSDAGTVRVYQYSNGSWSQIGDDIDGGAYSINGDSSGYSVSLSSDGSIVAIGAPDESAQDSINRGAVKVYKRDTNVALGWTQLGSDITGNGAQDKLGHSVSLSSNGSIHWLAIGAIEYDPFPANEVNTGYVKVLQYNSGNVEQTGWNQLGSDIVPSGGSGGDDFGFSVALNGDGSIVAIGAECSSTHSNSAGKVRVYQYNQSSGSWSQIGSDIVGETANYPGEQSGYSLAISNDGTIVAIGAPGNDSANGNNSGHVRVYENINGTWTKLGDDIDGDGANDAFGHSVAIDASGNTVAIGAINYDVNVEGDLAVLINSGNVRVYEYS